MAWARLDDRANGNAKLIALGNVAFRLWACGLIYCQANLTDGVIPEHAIPTFGVRATPAQRRTAINDELCQSLVPGKGPMWQRTKGGYEVHDYLDWNDSRETILVGRAQGKARLDRFKKRVSNADRNGDHPRVQTGDHQGGETAFERSSTTTTTSTARKDHEQTSAFDAFWTAYPRKVAKQAAAAEWQRAGLELIAITVLTGLERARGSRTWQEAMREPEMPHIPHPRTWLHQRRWEDLVTSAAPARSSVAVSAEVQALCDSAGLAQFDIARWFEGADLVSMDDGARLIVPDQIKREWIGKHYLAKLIDAADYRLELVESEAA